jgi:hypothetical protein
MKNIYVIVTIIIIEFGFLQEVISQKNIRDTSLFNEHQVKFEQMDYISHIKGLKMLRKHNNDSSQLIINGDPYWISCLVTNEEYLTYLNSIKSDSTIDFYNKAIPKNDLLIQKIDRLDISLGEYLSNTQYKYYPVLGINWYQANDYCIWKTNMVNVELQKVNLPKEKNYRLPKQAEIEYAKKFVDINKPRISKIDSTYGINQIMLLNEKINEWTGEAFVDSTYLSKISNKNDSEKSVVYRKNETANTYENKENGFLYIGFRYAQTFRTVKNSE